MPMHQAILTFLFALTLAWVGTRLRPRVASDLLRLRFWMTLAVVAAASSTTSVLASSWRRAGTGTTTSYGWPKPFYFRYVSEGGVVSDGYSLIYFVGNSLALGGAMLIAWTGWRLVRR